MVHQRLDIERWKQLFPLEKLRKEAREFVEALRREEPDRYESASDVEDHIQLMSPGGEIVTSPGHLAVVEQLREECLGNKCLPELPTDVFVFARGEPLKRGVTKIGGLPFWPRERSWPAGQSGQPMSFVAQFCFADSTDLVHSLPGDLLLVFADGMYGKDWHDGDAGALRFEWVKLSGSRLVEAADMPAARWELFPVYGEIHRTTDYLTGGTWEREWWSILLKTSRSPRTWLSALGARRRLEKDYRTPWCIAVIEGTKIGGVPRWIQRAEKMPGRFLCALGSINPLYQTSEEDPIHRPYPFTNFQGPFVRYRRAFRGGGEEIDANRLLMWGDVGSLLIFLSDNGAIHWTIQSY